MHRQTEEPVTVAAGKRVSAQNISLVFDERLYFPGGISVQVEVKSCKRQIIIEDAPLGVVHVPSLSCCVPCCLCSGGL